MRCAVASKVGARERSQKQQGEKTRRHAKFHFF
jgi:hypothetical protein